MTEGPLAADGGSQRRAVGWALAIVGLLMIGYATLMPGEDWPAPDGLCIVCGDVGGVDVVLNVILFIPLGVGLSLARVPRRYAIPAMCALTLTVELLQISIIPRRDATIGDVLMNSIGGVLGFALVSAGPRLIHARQGSARMLAGLWGGLWLMVQSIASYSFVPALPASTYYGQITRQLGAAPAYPGTVLSSSIAGRPIPDWTFKNSAEVRLLLGRPEGADVQMVVVPRGPIVGERSIVRVADDEEREIVRLAAHGPDLVLAFRTAATTLRLRPIEFRLRDVFGVAPVPGLASLDTIGIRARYSVSQVILEAKGRRGMQSSTVRPTASEGWRLVFPVQTWVDAGWTSGRLMSVLWLVGLLLPIGFWTAAGVRRDPSLRAAAISAALVTSLLACGLVLVPLAFGLRPAGLVDWLSASTGVVVGACLSRFLRPREQTP